MLVLALLAIITAVSAPRMISFFRGRALSEESRRMLALVHYAQSRAVAEGVPVVLWFSPAASTYGQNIQPGFTTTDEHASSFAPGIEPDPRGARSPARRRSRNWATKPWA